MKRIAKPLKEARIAEGWTQEDLARACLITSTTISHIENGRVRPFNSTRRRIEAVLGKIDWGLTHDKSRIYHTVN